METTYSLSIVTYDRGSVWNDDSIKKPFHWSFFVESSSTSPKTGHEYQLKGMPGGFSYRGEETADLQTKEGIVEILEVGIIPARKLSLVKEILQGVPIIVDEASKWNCQSWCLEALDRLREEGFVLEDYSNEVFRYWLREEK